MREPNKQEQPLIRTNDFKPFVPPESNIPEFTFRALVLGLVLGAIFGSANAYLGLKIGMTISSSIPAAVISMAILKGVLRRGTILENNLAQTVTSTSSAQISGVIFTIPAFIIIVNADTTGTLQHIPPYWEACLLAILGAFIGLLFMIPLRRYLIVKEHLTLPYPEGTACAKILEAGEKGGTGARLVFWGILIGGSYNLLLKLGKFWSDSVSYVFDRGPLRNATVAADFTPELLGVGMIVGLRVALFMLTGAVLGWFVVVPILTYLGNEDHNLIVAPAKVFLYKMSAGEVRENYLKYIGVGAVAMGGLISLLKSLPVIIASFKHGLKAIGERGENKIEEKRTDRDLSMSVIIIGLIAVIAVMCLVFKLDIVASCMVILFSFLFVTVSSRLVGLIGCSSNPISGMTIATILMTALTILFLWGIDANTSQSKVQQAKYYTMLVGAIVCIACGKAGDISQDLKAGYLVGATPRWQQIGQMIAAIIPVFVTVAVVFLLLQNNGIEGQPKVLDFQGNLATAQDIVPAKDGIKPLEAPQAAVMGKLINGVFNHDLPWTFILIGVGLAIFFELLRIPALPVALGLYLKINISVTILIGALLAKLLLKQSADKIKTSQNTILTASGVIAGAALMGVLYAVLAISFGENLNNFSNNISGWLRNNGLWHNYLGPLLIFGLMATIIGYLVKKSSTQETENNK